MTSVILDLAGILAGLLISQPITKHVINMAGEVNITFVVESKNLWKSGKSGHRRAKWSWFTTIDEESGSDVDPTETDAESGSEASSSAREASEATSEDELNEGDSSAESMSSESSTGESDEEDENFE